MLKSPATITGPSISWSIPTSLRTSSRRRSAWNSRGMRSPPSFRCVLRMYGILVWRFRKAIGPFGESIVIRCHQWPRDDARKPTASRIGYRLEHGGA